MDEQKTIEPEMENQAGTETLETAPKQPEAPKQEESPYAKQLEDLKKRAEEAEKKVKDQEEIIANKNRAIESTKQKLKDSPPDQDLEERLLKRLRDERTQESVAAKVAALTADQAERELVLRHYQSSIVKTGDLDVDLKNAVALANADQMWEQRRNRALEERREDFMTSFAGSSLGAAGAVPKMQDPILSAAAEIVRAVNPKAVEFLKKQ